MRGATIKIDLRERARPSGKPCAAGCGRRRCDMEFRVAATGPWMQIHSACAQRLGWIRDKVGEFVEDFAKGAAGTILGAFAGALVGRTAGSKLRQSLPTSLTEKKQLPEASIAPRVIDVRAIDIK